MLTCQAIVDADDSEVIWLHDYMWKDTKDSSLKSGDKKLSNKTRKAEILKLDIIVCASVLIRPSDNSSMANSFKNANIASLIFYECYKTKQKLLKSH